MSDDDDVPAGIDFRDPAGVQKWLATAETDRPWRPELRRRIAELVREKCPAPTRILELGPGPGFLAEEILRTCDVADYTLLDFSPIFLDMCRERVGHTGLARFVLGDFKQPDWPLLVKPPFHAVVTMQAVHELRHKRHAVALYRQVLPLLAPNGWLIVCDHNPKDDARSMALHASDVEQREAMAAAGFGEIGLNYLGDGRYICSATRPG